MVQDKQKKIVFCANKKKLIYDPFYNPYLANSRSFLALSSISHFSKDYEDQGNIQFIHEKEINQKF